mmetsp:Transcript_11921/g.26503  ORF Transcript_11921/g.26503 Transcript_11921/m.26503 type:complete len:331 (-) Transcript_11921:1436-2428(-)
MDQRHLAGQLELPVLLGAHKHLGVSLGPLSLLQHASGGEHLRERVEVGTQEVHASVALEEFHKAATYGIPQLADTAHLHEARIAQLVLHSRRCEHAPLLEVVALHAAHEVGEGGVQSGHQIVQLGLELPPQCLLLVPLLARRVLLGGEEAAHQRGGGLAQDGLYVHMQLVPVLLQEGGDVVEDHAGVVLNAEVPQGVFALLGLGAQAVGVLRVLGEDLAQQAFVGPPGHVDLLVDHGKHARGLGLQQVQGGLVVHEGRAWDDDALFFVQGLLHAEYVLVEVELQFFVAEVDAELFEGVHLEVLETEDVQHADERGTGRPPLAQLHVDGVH